MTYKNYRNTNVQWRRVTRLVIVITLIAVLGILGLHLFSMIVWLQITTAI